ncbi:flagellar protein FlgN [Novosphingobium sp. KCTC 2891]|uniref:flagellar protein FlgN n=1 Tax=Novosphingobium sp. KCTC 2891 TaxID=2989730 RepID=UPI0022222846|nr:flagellar protein FlgN [Novosphingobium sp. KCTC 2891]MCW1382985.1 flagellar protein FlgN [Novosphingobium sp. KCTC 2891]
MAMSINPIARPLELRDTLRQMLAVLEEERHALAGLDVDAIMGCAVDKNALCGRIDTAPVDVVDDECRGLLDAARRINESNRRVRNLIAANVAARLDAMTGQPALYRAHAAPARIGRPR